MKKSACKIVDFQGRGKLDRLLLRPGLRSVGVELGFINQIDAYLIGHWLVVGS